MRRTPLWCPIAYFYFTTSTRVRTLRCAERHSGSRSHIPFVDVNEDSHLSMRRTPLWCPIATSILRRQRGFVPIHAQNTTRLPDRICHGIYSQDTLAPGWPFLGRLSGPFIGRACAREARALCRPCLAGLPGTYTTTIRQPIRQPIRHLQNTTDQQLFALKERKS